MYRATQNEPTIVPRDPINRWVALAPGAALLFAAIGARLFLAPSADDGATLLMMVPGIVATAALGGALPGLALSALAMFAAFWIWRGAPVVWLDVALFAVVAVAFCAFGERIRVISRRHDTDARRLREREAHLQSILDTVPDGMVVIDEAGVMRSFSAAAEKLFGWTSAEVLGKPLEMLMGAPYREAHEGYMRHYAETGERRIIGIGRVVEGQRRDGSIFRIHLSVGEMKVGDIRYFTGFMRDLTDREETETRLRELQAELVHVSRLTAMGEMASALAHELNQPLSAIANYLRGSRRLLDRGDPADRPRLSEALGKAADQALRAGDVIHRLREFVGRGETEKRIENLRKLIEESSDLALLGARELGVRVSMRLDPACELALVDRVQIQQVLLNLLRNGLDAMRAAPRRDLTVNLGPAADGLVMVSVADTGSGIDAETMTKLFQPFMTTKKDGMGVGLSICRTIVEAHGGAIWAETNPEGGATFRFTLPSASEPIVE